MTNHLEKVALEFAASKTRELADLALEASGGSNDKAYKDLLDAVHEIRAFEPGWVRLPAMCLLASARFMIEPTPPADLWSRLPLETAQNKLDEGDIDGARTLADELYEQIHQSEREGADGSNYGNLVHDANIIKGLVCLAEGHADAAGAALVAAGMTPGSPTLDSSGPDLTLAWKLLDVNGEAVLSYLRSVSRFWSPS